MISVAVAGAAGRMGQTVCAAVEGAEDMELTGRADPALGTSVADVLGDADVLVDFTQPDQALGNAREALAAGVHVVIGTSGFDQDGAARGGARVERERVLRAELRDRRGADDALRRRGVAASWTAPRSSSCTTRRKLDAPSGTAARTAEMMEGDVPIHSVRLPGIVADQEVILGDVAQTLTIRHVTTDRTSFMPGVLLAVRKVGGAARVPGDRARAPPVALVAVTDHAVERYRQRVRGHAGPAHGDRRAGGAGARRPGRVEPGERGARLVRDVERPSLVYVCMEDRVGGELIVVTLWEEGEDAAVPRKWTRWRER